MNDFYTLPESEKEACFRRLVEQALPLWGHQSAQCVLIKQRENAVFAVHAEDGARFVMRVHRAEYHSNEELLSELQWVAALAEFGVETPQVIPAVDGALFKTVQVPQVPEPRQIDVMAWIDGKQIGSIEQAFENLPDAIRNYRVIGKLMAQMHSFATQWQSPPGFTRRDWDEQGLLGEEPLWGRFWELEILNAEQRVRLLAGRQAALQALQSYGKGDDRYSLIHADTLPENFLVDVNGTIRVIDFDDGGYGWHLFDFATALFPVLGKDCFNDLLQALVTGYQEIRSLPPEFDQLLPLFFLLRGFTYLGWVHTRKETASARELAPVVVQGVMSLLEGLSEQSLA
jgi:Ser/Thr protein kinase RdoA (MazF antagonist)